ncbi:MAG: FecR domain-containing protein [Bacteroidetes bacterium]|nr:FecR domain-containing protein [Bacteroidota bacterium]
MGILPDNISDELLVRFFENSASAEDQKIVQGWADSNEENRSHLSELRDIWERSAEVAYMGEINLDHDWNKIKAGMQESRTLSKPGGKIRNLYWVSAAAAGLVFAFIAVQFVFEGTNDGNMMASAMSGSEIILLSDGSKVTLRKNSTLNYPLSFDGDKRQVSLDGEGFFEVAPDRSKSFVVKTGDTWTKVLGTAFNINNNGQQVIVSVSSGRVAFLSEAQEDSVILTKGETGRYDNETRILTEMVNTDSNFLSWKTGILIFRKSPIVIVFRDLERHFDVQFQVSESFQKTETLTATFDNQPLEEVLEEISITLSISFEQKGKFIIVK